MKKISEITRVLGAQRPTILLLLLLLSILAQANNNNLRAYPLADDYFEKIYLLTLNNQDYYLNIGCREANMLSISLTPTLNFM